jgi:hypothetical protein
LARPEHFTGMAGLGFELITHSRGIVDAAAAAGVDCSFLGTGLPWELPRPASKEVDAVGLLANRWAPLVRKVAGELGKTTVDLVEEAPNDEVLARMARARVLIWPSRIEGHATIPHEARSVGCVPVALSTNPFAVGLDDESGALVVDTADEIAPAVRGVLTDRERLEGLASRAAITARDETAWQPFVDRVTAWLDAPAPPAPGRGARAGAGAALSAVLEEERAISQSRLEEAVWSRGAIAELLAELRWPPVRAVRAPRKLYRWLTGRLRGRRS